MPKYVCSDGVCAKYLSDAEKKEMGYMGGDCVLSSLTRFMELTHKFGNHFEIVFSLGHRETSSLRRLMDKKEDEKFMSSGKFIGHFVVFNRKTKQYIDTSNKASIIIPEEAEHRKFFLEKNRMYALYHMPIQFIGEASSGDPNPCRFLCSFLTKYQVKPPSNKQERKWAKAGMTIYKGKSSIINI